MKQRKGVLKPDTVKNSRTVHRGVDKKEASNHTHHVYSSILNLREKYGNRYVQRLIEKGKLPCNELCGQDRPPAIAHAYHSCDNCPFHTRVIKQKAPGSPPSGGIIQPKLMISDPGDIYEQEADRVADAVLQKKCDSPECEDELIQPATASYNRISTKLNTSSTSLKSDYYNLRWAGIPAVQRIPLIQKQVEPEEELLQQKGTSFPIQPVAGVTEINETITQQLKRQQGNGRPLEPDNRSFMETRFGHDFGNVRIHADSRAAEVSSHLGAKAFTYGRDIYFGEGKFDPDSASGQRLLAHELTHVIQQTGR